MRPSDWLPLLGDIADRADEIALTFFGTKRLRVEQKPDASPVTEADRADVAALQVIVEEAGGRATGLGGERSIYTGSLVTSNGALHEAMLDTLSRATEGVA